MRNKRNLLLLIIVIIPVLFIFINRTFSLSYTEEIKSVEIESNDYNNPGSWHIDKSAEWTGFGKVRVTFDVNSVIKTVDGRYKDVILVMDISGSMYGDKLDRAKEDAIDLTNYLLSDSNNKVALITFNSNSTLVSGFTNNKSQMVDYINNISAIGTTNYNSGLLNVDNVMEDYVRDENTDLITLFLTDGYPNEDTPNQVATYQVLKDKYPYMTINGIQYEMGQDIIQEIIDISDNQFIANINTLNNILFEATISSIKYENFVIEDYIYGDYFYVDSANDIEVPFGTVTVENVNGTQKITWNLGNNYATGRNVKMNINLKQKEAYHNTRGLYPTNQSENIISKLPDEIAKTKSSEDTPVLLNERNVIYETNSPSGCTLPSIQSEKYIAYQTVTKRSDVLSCPGYIFKGWYIKGSDIDDIHMINDDTFIMPPHDVTIRGTWTKQEIVKTMDGTVKTKIDGRLRSQDDDLYLTFSRRIDKEKFESITTVDDIMIPATAIDYWDASDGSNGSVFAWYTDVDNDNLYELYIGQDGGVKANYYSGNAFSNFINVESISLDNFDTSKVINMNRMFYYTGKNASNLDITGLNDWDTSKVTNMKEMFRNVGPNIQTFNIDLSNWDVSNVTDMSYMFNETGKNATDWSIGDLSNWNTSKVTNMEYMFNEAGRTAAIFDIGNLGNWNTGNVTNMGSMFYYAGSNATTWNIGNLDNWDTKKVTKMSQMFQESGYNSTTWSIGDLSNWDTSNVIYMSGMFAGSFGKGTTFDIGDLSNWDVSKVTSMSQMFANAGRNATTWDIGDLSNWDTSSVTSMASMFNRAGYSVMSFDISFIKNWDVSKVTTMDSMFYNAGYNVQSFDLDLSGWNTSSLKVMSNMFYNTGLNSQSFNLNLSGLDTSQVITMESTFNSTAYYATTFNLIGLNDWDTSKVTTMEKTFHAAGKYAQTWSIGDLSNWDTSNVTTMRDMFAHAGFKATNFNLNLSNWDVSNVTIMSDMFNSAGIYATTWSIGDLSNWDTSKVTSMHQMFWGAGQNATVWNSIGVLKVYASSCFGLFYGCKNANATLNIYNNPTEYGNILNNAATVPGSGITINYTSAVTNIDDIIATKSNDSNVVKGVQLD